MKKVLWIICLVVLAGATYYMITGLETEMQHLGPDADPVAGTKAVTGEPEETEDIDGDMDSEEVYTSIFSSVIDDSEWELENNETFFVEYRLQRDRVRAQEVELLESLIGNPQAGEEYRNEAEEKKLKLVDLMEKELLIENMLKAQGYEDALFFYRNDKATVMLKTDNLNDKQLAQVAETVSSVTAVSREAVQILMQY